MVPRLFQLIILLSSKSFATAIDIILHHVECNDTLQLYVVDNQLTMECNGTNHCSLGAEARFTGRLQYQGVEDLGLVDGYAFASADMDFVGVHIDILDYLQVPMCGSYVFKNGYDDNNGIECPGDGIYNFDFTYLLPAEHNKAMWLATGWDGQADVEFYSQANNPESLIGSCLLSFKTAVTPSTGTSAMEKVPLPSAMITALVILGFALLLILSCLYRMVRDCTTGKKKTLSEMLKEEDAKTATGTSFVQMQDKDDSTRGDARKIPMV